MCNISLFLVMYDIKCCQNDYLWYYRPFVMDPFTLNYKKEVISYIQGFIACIFVIDYDIYMMSYSDMGSSSTRETWNSCSVLCSWRERGNIAIKNKGESGQACLF